MLCIVSNDSRMGFLYSSVFHPSRHYRTRLLPDYEGADKDANCMIRWRPDRQ
jgi:hypothetical protein